MKALIPAAGFGSRLRPLTFSRPKPVLPVAGQPIIAYALQHLRSVGIEDIAIVTSDATEAPLRAALADWPDVTFLRQAYMGGLGHAVAGAEEWADGDDLCVMLADNLFEHSPAGLLQAFRDGGAHAALALIEVEDPRAFGVAELDGEGASGRVRSIVEKPEQPETNLAVAGLYCFTPRIFKALRQVPVSARGELELTDAISWLIRDGAVVRGYRQPGWWKDTGRPADLLEANAWMLARQGSVQRGTVEHSLVQGNVVIEAGARVCRSVIVGPAYIGPDAVIEDARLGPSVSVGRGAQVIGAIVRHSILEAGACVSGLSGTLSDSILGQGAQLSRQPATSYHQCLMPDASTLSIAGD